MARLIDQSIARVRRFVRRRDVTKSGLARKAKIGPNALTHLYEPTYNPSAQTLRKLETYIERVERRSRRN